MRGTQSRHRMRRIGRWPLRRYTGHLRRPIDAAPIGQRESRAVYAYTRRHERRSRHRGRRQSRISPISGRSASAALRRGADELGAALCHELGCDVSAFSAVTKVLADRLTREGQQALRRRRSHSRSGHQPKSADLFLDGPFGRVCRPSARRTSDRCGNRPTGLVGSARGARAARHVLARLAWFPPAATSNRVEARLALAPPTPPGMRVRTGRFAQHSRKRR